MVSPFIQFIFWICLLAGAGYFLIGTFRKIFSKRAYLKHTGETAEAIIIDFEISRGVDEGTYYYALYEFYTREGKRVVVTSKDGRPTKQDFKKKVFIVYSPNDPQDHYVKGHIPAELIILVIFVLPAIVISAYQLYKLFAN